KIFLFEANLPEKSYEESRYCAPGESVLCVPIDDWVFGLAICFDLRFPELFRRLKSKGAHAVLIPSSFAQHTGQAHWDTLVRCRAIENQIFVAAPNQYGVVGDGSLTFGNTLVVSPWG